MGRNRKWAAKESFQAVAETCPHVDSAMAAAADSVKVQTNELREALVDALERALDAEEKAAELQIEVQKLEPELQDAREQISA